VVVVVVDSQIFHPNVVLFMGACTDPTQKLMVVTERLPTDLHALLIENKTKYDLSLRKRMKMAKEAALGINWLHSGKQQFIHRDLKLSNLLVTHDFHVRVADFGLTRVKDKKGGDGDTPQGSPAYMAPEVYMGHYDEKCDVYSFGMVLWEMLTQERVFADIPNLQKLMFAVVEEGRRPALPPNTPTSLRNLITACWDASPAKRPSFKEILEQLDHVLVDVVVQDHSARAMWKKYFWGKSSIPWDEFAKAIVDSLQLDPPTPDSASELELLCLKELVASVPKRKRVTQQEAMGERAKMTSFGNMVQCFGPFDRKFLYRLRKVLESKWFFGAIGQNDAEEAIKSHKTVGTFLIRFSSTPGFFTLSFSGKAQLEHHRIISVPGTGFVVWGQTYKDLFEVVAAGKDSKKILKKPCDGYPYAHLFVDKKAKKKSSAPVQSGYNIPTAQEIAAASYGAGMPHK
jgi:serine/threonine protein kinase